MADNILNPNGTLGDRWYITGSVFIYIYIYDKMQESYICFQLMNLKQLLYTAWVLLLNYVSVCQIWIAMEKSFMKWAPGGHYWDCYIGALSFQVKSL